jgi:hypothetical protein
MARLTEFHRQHRRGSDTVYARRSDTACGGGARRARPSGSWVVEEAERHNTVLFLSKGHADFPSLRGHPAARVNARETAEGQSRLAATEEEWRPRTRHGPRRDCARIRHRRHALVPCRVHDN